MANRTAIVTGASRGIGRRIALELAHRGYDITLSARTVDANTSVVGSLRETAAAIEAVGVDVLVVGSDITDRHDIVRLVDLTVSHFGRLDAVVNNAALTHSGSHSLTQTNYADWTAQFDVNVHGPFVLMQAAIPHLASTGHGVIVNVSSSSADLVTSDAGPRLFGLGYAASKAALNRLSNALAPEFRDLGVAIVTVDPGSVRTERVSLGIDSLTDAHRARLVGMDVPATAVGHLVSCSDPLRYTGQLLRAPQFVEAGALISAVPD